MQRQFDGGYAWSRCTETLIEGGDNDFKPANVEGSAGKPARTQRIVRDTVARTAVPAKQGRNHPFPTLASTGRARVIGKILGAEGDRRIGTQAGSERWLQRDKEMNL